MSKTAVGLFEHSDLAHQVVHDLETGAFPQGEIRILGESRDMSVDGVMSTPRTDFEVSLNRELQAIGANGQEAIAYVKGVRRGGVLVFATGSIEQVDNAAEIMNRHGAIDVEKARRQRTRCRQHGRREHDSCTRELQSNRADQSTRRRSPHVCLVASAMPPRKRNRQPPRRAKNNVNE